MLRARKPQPHHLRRFCQSVAGLLCLLLLPHCYIELKPVPVNCASDPNLPECQRPKPSERSAIDSGQPTEQTASCGNGVCDKAQGETCETCQADCACPSEQRCTKGTCLPFSRCGDGICDASGGETCSNCVSDCPCKGGLTCRQDRCLPQCKCSPGQQRCQENKVEVCEADCQTWKTVETCSSPMICNPKTDKCECKTSCPNIGLARCSDDKTLEVCTKEGLCSQWKSSACGWEETCKNDKCCECKPGETRCNGQTYDQTCGPDCKWKPKYSCKKINILSFCVNGKCLKP